MLPKLNEFKVGYENNLLTLNLVFVFLHFFLLLFLSIFFPLHFPSNFLRIKHSHNEEYKNNKHKAQYDPISGE